MSPVANHKAEAIATVATQLMYGGVCQRPRPRDTHGLEERGQAATACPLTYR